MLETWPLAGQALHEQIVPVYDLVCVVVGEDFGNGNGGALTQEVVDGGSKVISAALGLSLRLRASPASL